MTVINAAAIAGTGNPSTTTVSLVDGKITMYNAGQFGPTGNVYRSLESIDGVNSRVLNELVNAGQSVVQASVTKNTADDETYPNTVTDNGTSSLVSDTYYYYAINDMSMQEDEQGTYMDAYLMAVVDYTAASSGTPEQLTAPVATCTATATTITPSWSTVTNAQSYKIRYGTSNPPTGDGSTATSGTAITGLTASTTYYAQVMAVGDGTNYLDSDWSDVFSGTTSALPQLSSPVATIIAGYTKFTPTFASIENASGYKVRYGTSNPPTGDGSTTTSGTAITGLSGSTAYYAQFMSVGTSGSYTDSDWSTVVSFTTTAAVPAAIHISTENASHVALMQLLTGYEGSTYTIGNVVATGGDNSLTYTQSITSQKNSSSTDVTYFTLVSENNNFVLKGDATTPSGTYTIIYRLINGSDYVEATVTIRVGTAEEIYTFTGVTAVLSQTGDNNVVITCPTTARTSSAVFTFQRRVSGGDWENIAVLDINGNAIN